MDASRRRTRRPRLPTTPRIFPGPWQETAERRYPHSAISTISTACLWSVGCVFAWRNRLDSIFYVSNPGPGLAFMQKLGIGAGGSLEGTTSSAYRDRVHRNHHLRKANRSNRNTPAARKQYRSDRSRLRSSSRRRQAGPGPWHCGHTNSSLSTSAPHWWHLVRGICAPIV